MYKYLLAYMTFFVGYNNNCFHVFILCQNDAFANHTTAVTINRLLLGVHYYSMTHLRWSVTGRVLVPDERLLSYAETLANELPRTPPTFRDALPRMIQDVIKISSPKKGTRCTIFFKNQKKRTVHGKSENHVIKTLASRIMVGRITSFITTLTVHSPTFHFPFNLIFTE